MTGLLLTVAKFYKYLTRLRGVRIFLKLTLSLCSYLYVRLVQAHARGLHVAEEVHHDLLVVEEVALETAEVEVGLETVEAGPEIVEGVAPEMKDGG